MYEESLGWLWPVKVYRKERGTAPPRRQIQSHTINNQVVRGVLMSEDDGNPHGAIKLTRRAIGSEEDARTPI